MSLSLIQKSDLGRTLEAAAAPAQMPAPDGQAAKMTCRVCTALQRGMLAVGSDLLARKWDTNRNTGPLLALGIVTERFGSRRQTCPRM